jgi:hypothetical protein
MTPRWLAWSVALTLGASAVEAQTNPVVTHGFVQASFAHANRSLNGAIVGNLYLPRNDQFLLDAAAFTVQRAAPADRAGTGFLVEAMAGNHAATIHAAGLDVGPQEDLVKAYLVLGLPQQKLQVSVGKMATMLGYEGIESVGNPNLSVGSQFIYIENFTDLGADVAWTGSRRWSARARIVNGWDVVADNNQRKTVFGRVGWSDGTRGVALLGYSGSELPDSVGGLRSGVEMLANTRLASIQAAVQLDAGREEALDADWRAAGVWLQAPLRAGMDLALRGDVLDDAKGVRTSGVAGFPATTGQTLTSATATVLLRRIPDLLIRPELRYDRSTLDVFDGHREQWTIALGAAMTF